MNLLSWIVDLRQLLVLLFGVCFLVSLLRMPNYERNQLVVCPPSAAIFLWLVAAILAIALTPEEALRGDKLNYTNSFYAIAYGLSDWKDASRDVLFYGWIRLVSLFSTNPTIFFLLTATVYVGGIAIALMRIERRYWTVMMIATVFGIGFFANGDNILRAGMAYSILLVGVSFFPTQKIVAILLAAVAFNIHNSMIIPISALVISCFYKNTKIIFAGWLILLAISIVFGNTTQTVLARFFEDAEDQRLTSYALGQHSDYKQGFRIDFLIYSFVPIALGLYYRFQKHFNDSFYVWVFNAYIVANGFWLLMIRAMFTDRFAYLSWGLMPIVLFYPLLKSRIWANQHFYIFGGLFLILLLTLILASRSLFEFLYQ